MNKVLLTIISFVLGVVLHKPAEDIAAWVIEKLKGYFDKDKIKEAKDSVVDAAENARDKAEEVLQGAIDATKDVAEQASDSLKNS